MTEKPKDFAPPSTRRRLRLPKISKERLDYFVQKRVERGETCMIMQKRGRILIYMYGQPYAECILKKRSDIFVNSPISNTYIRSFIALISKCVNDYIRKNDFTIPIIPRLSPKSVWTNPDKFNEIKIGETFNNIDMDNAYWQMMHKQGVISNNVYSNYRYLYDYRALKQISIGLVQAPTIVTHIVNGIRQDPIYEDKSLHAIVYRNIRTMTYNIIQEIHLHLRENGSESIAWNVDSIYATKEDTKLVTDFLRARDIEFKITICKKISETEYTQNTKIKRIAPKRKFNTNALIELSPIQAEGNVFPEADMDTFMEKLRTEADRSENGQKEY